MAERGLRGFRQGRCLSEAGVEAHDPPSCQPGNGDRAGELQTILDGYLFSHPDRSGLRVLDPGSRA